MALENAESVSDTLPLSDTLERVPDSAPLRVSTKTELESGIPPARGRYDLSVEDGLLHMESALASVTRTEANLGLLVRGLKHLAAGALAARDANTELIHELDELRGCLTRSHEEEQALRFRMGQLEQLLDVIRHESSSERAFLIEQQDLFLVEIMTDHDRQIADLRRQLTSGGPRQLTDGGASADAAREIANAAREIAELTLQRDQAREYATRCERERDAAWHELATGHEPPAVTVRRHATPPPLPPEAFTTVTRQPSGGLAIGSISLRAVQAPTTNGPDTERSSERPASTGYSLSGEDVAE
jgi:hypothetical protein